MKRIILLSLVLLPSLMYAQQKTEVTEFNLEGPYAVAVPFSADSVDVNGKVFDELSLMNALTLSNVTDGNSTVHLKGARLPSLDDQKSIGILSFYVNNANYLKGRVDVKGPQKYKLYVDGTETSGELNLAPEHHMFCIKYLAEPRDTDSINVTIEAPQTVITTVSKVHPYMVHDLTDGRRVRGVAVSADGAYVVLSYQITERGGQSRWEYELRDTKKLQLVRALSQNVRWMPRACAYIEEVWEGNKRVLYKVEASTGQRVRLAYDLPQGRYTVSPTEDYLVLSASESGPNEDADVFQVLEMDDRQPGWRSRSYLMRYDLQTGVCQRVTFGHKGQYLLDISTDGTKWLIGSNYSRLERRPTEVMDVLLMDARTLQVDTLLMTEGFLGGGWLSPDGKQVLFKGTPEAFNRIGCQLSVDRTPSMIENELFLYDILSKQVTPLTKDFDPSVSKVCWSNADGLVYFSAENRDYVHLYQLNPLSGSITQLEMAGDNAYQFDMSTQSNVLGYLSYATMAPASAFVAYVTKGKSAMKQKLVFDGRTVIANTSLGTCQDWNFTNAHGDTVYGRLYLPHDFDASKKYPMIVYYYGGCSPTSRYFESPYAPQYWNSLGYVAYIVQPSGAAGFGQEWASRHVNTAGRGPAEDIIEGTKKICEEHPFIDASKVGCMGASYGGFMTQYLQTQTDIFAAAVSHAGIANHTSYWGEGFGAITIAKCQWLTAIPGATASCMWTSRRCSMPTRSIRLYCCFMVPTIQMSPSLRVCKCSLH